MIEEQAMSGRPEPARDAVDDRCRGYVTISVDDGHPSDIKTADLLRQLGFRATFYVPATNHDQPILTKSQLRLLAEDFEVGSHTFSHVALPTLPLDRARQEIADGKRWLEDVLGAPVRSFCYPLGRFNRRIVRLVAEAGFDGARTTMNHIVDWPADPFTCATTTQAFSHSRTVSVRHAARERNWRGLVNYGLIFHAAVPWTQHFDVAAGYVARHGGVVHLWLHSWELDETRQWDQLVRALRQVRDHHRLTPATNHAVFRRSRAPIAAIRNTD
jgi:Polysaccharide deacetylase